MNKNNKIFIAGHKGLVGSAITEKLINRGFTNLLTKTHKELDLTNQKLVNEFFYEEKPSYVILAAGKVGGIFANNTYPADFIYKNLMIQSNVIDASYNNNVKRLLFLGSSCIYPKSVTQPMNENAILTDTLEPTNEPYALAKIAGIKLCESYNRQHDTDFRSVMPTNLYGKNDNFHLKDSHVIPSVMRRLHLAKCIELEDWKSFKLDLLKRPIPEIDELAPKEKIIIQLQKYGIYAVPNNIDSTFNVTVNIWGSGNAMREFLHVNDMADASLFVLGLDKEVYKLNTKSMISHINIGTGKDVTIRDMVQVMKRVTGFNGSIAFDISKPDGAKRKLLDVSRLKKMGWSFEIELEDGLKKTYADYMKGQEYDT
jgi:GDP-L-fucose synthase